MTREDLAARRKREYLKATGRGYMMEGEEAQPALDHVRDLHARGMSCTAMAAQCGVAQSVVTELNKGFRYRYGKLVPVNKLRRSTFNAIMSVRFVPPEAGRTVSRSGARIPCVEARRQLQALQAKGFSLSVLAAQTGRQKAWLGRFTCGSIGSYSHSYTITEFSALYDKLKGADPADYGMTKQAIANVASQSRRKGYAPGHCWEDDGPDEEIGGFSHQWNDPDAIPEWTGACGTIEGYYLHIKYGMLPNCPPCRKAKTAYNRSGELKPGLGCFELDIRNMISLGNSHEEIISVLGCSVRTVERAVRKLATE